MAREASAFRDTQVTRNSSPLAPSPSFPEYEGRSFERIMASNTNRRGPLRFEEGLASDRDIPNEFGNGVRQGYETAGGKNKNVYEKYPEETMHERAHVGSASWVEAPTYLGEFSHGCDAPLAERKFEMVNRGRPNPQGARYERHNPAQVND